MTRTANCSAPGFWNESSRTPLRMVYHGKDVFAERDLDAALERAVKLRRGSSAPG